MSLIKFLQIIDNSYIGRFVDKKLGIVQRTETECIYIENVRAFYNIPNWTAKFLCDVAVRENQFVKKIGVYCPHCDRMVGSADRREDFPETITCDVCELMEEDEFEFHPLDKDFMEFYQLKKSENVREE